LFALPFALCSLLPGAFAGTVTVGPLGSGAQFDKLADAVAARYDGWRHAEAQAMLSGQRSLGDIAARVAAEGIEPQPRSGGQERFENLVNRFV